MTDITFAELIERVAKQEMEMVGADPSDLNQRILHLEAVRRIQGWTFEAMKEVAPPGPLRDMMDQFQHGVLSVPDLELWLDGGKAIG